MKNRVELNLEFRLSVKVKGFSVTVPEDELRKCLEKEVTSDIEHYMEHCNGGAGCCDKLNRTYGYNFESQPVKRVV